MLLYIDLLITLYFDTSALTICIVFYIILGFNDIFNADKEFIVAKINIL